MTPQTLTRPDCSHCDGRGAVLFIGANGERSMVRCRCRLLTQRQQLVEDAAIPMGLQLSSLTSAVWASCPTPQQNAVSRALQYVDTFSSKAAGLLFTGAAGDRKSTLAAGLLIRLIQKHDVQGHFCRYRLILERLRATYDLETTTETEEEVLEPLLQAEVLVVDELGGGKWNRGFAAEAFALVIDQRYREMRPTIFTSDFPAEPSAGRLSATLGDRVGDHLLSRVLAMTEEVSLNCVGAEAPTNVLPFTPRHSRRSGS